MEGRGEREAAAVGAAGAPGCSRGASAEAAEGTGGCRCRRDRTVGDGRPAAGRGLASRAVGCGVIPHPRCVPASRCPRRGVAVRGSRRRAARAGRLRGGAPGAERGGRGPAPSRVAGLAGGSAGEGIAARRAAVPG